MKFGLTPQVIGATARRLRFAWVVAVVGLVQASAPLALMAQDREERNYAFQWGAVLIGFMMGVVPLFIRSGRQAKVKRGTSVQDKLLKRAKKSVDKSK